MKITKKYHTRVIPAKEEIIEDRSYMFCCQRMENLMWATGNNTSLSICTGYADHTHHYRIGEIKFCPFCGAEIVTEEIKDDE